MNNPIIVIFDHTDRSIAFIEGNPAKIEFVQTLPRLEEEKILKIIENSKITPPRLKVENSDQALGVSLAPITDNSQFLPALEEELKIAGFRTKIVPNLLKPLLVYISAKLSDEQISQIIGELVNIPLDTDEKTIKELEDLIIKLKEKKG